MPDSVSRFSMRDGAMGSVCSLFPWLHHIVPGFGEFHANGFMEGNETGDDRNDAGYDEQPSQNLFEGQQQTLLLEGRVEPLSRHLGGFGVSVSLSEGSL